MTSPRVGAYVDPVQLVVDWLEAQLVDPVIRVRTRLPDTITEDTIWVAYAGGGSAGDNVLPRVDLQSFRPGGEGDAQEVAKRGHNAMRALGGQTVNGQAVDNVDVWSWPAGQFWSPTVDRVIATYELDLPVYI